MLETLELTPIDNDVTKLLPLPVLMQSADFNLSRADYHHHFHPERSNHLGFDPYTKKLFEDDHVRIEGRALRHSRGQYMPRWLHERYHQLFLGPDLPETTQSKFTAVVLACSGIVPRQALDLYTPGEYKVVELSDKQHNFIRSQVFFEGAQGGRKSKRNTIGWFLADYVMANSIEGVVSEREVKQKVREFLSPKSELQRRQAGRFILTYAIDASVATLLPVHQEAKKEGLVTHPRRSLGQVILEFFTEDRFIDYYDHLEHRVRALSGLVA